MQHKLSPSEPCLMYNSKVVNIVALLCNVFYAEEKLKLYTY